VVEIPSATPSGRSVPQMAKAAVLLSAGVAKAVPVLRRLRPAAVVGFGGYPTVPPVVAAALLRVPAVIHEQNGVMGRANRFVARWATLIATGFPHVKGLPAGANTIHTGNPVRPAVLKAAEVAYPQLDANGPLKLLVFGGSQGARVMSDIVPPALERSRRARSRLVVQQARRRTFPRSRAPTRGSASDAEIAALLQGPAARMAEAHLVIGRSGARRWRSSPRSGRPSILVPSARGPRPGSGRQRGASAESAPPP
jgi:UDP-N-acetylglucosamine--N-acetylmuramyl-(pentapeptide) pyrophosphoryl-undecaprenol N-acetylglucosamine transferase